MTAEVNRLAVPSGIDRFFESCPRFEAMDQRCAELSISERAARVFLGDAVDAWSELAMEERNEEWVTLVCAEDWVRLSCLAPATGCPLARVSLHTVGDVRSTLLKGAPGWGELAEVISLHVPLRAHRFHKVLSDRFQPAIEDIHAVIDWDLFWEFVISFLCVRYIYRMLG